MCLETISQQICHNFRKKFNENKSYKNKNNVVDRHSTVMKSVKK